MKWIKFKGKKYLLIASGVIATKKQYQNGECSYAVLDEDRVMRYGKQIGNKADIEIIGEAEDIKPNISVGGLLSNFLGEW